MADPASEWLGGFAPDLVPFIDSVATATHTSRGKAAELLAGWVYGIHLDPSDELAVLEATGQGGSLRACVLRLSLATDRMAAELLAAARSVKPQQVGALLESASRVDVVRRTPTPAPLRCKLGFHRWRFVMRITQSAPMMGTYDEACEHCDAVRRG